MKRGSQRGGRGDKEEGIHPQMSQMTQMENAVENKVFR
jgi:hypothetical protein